MARIAKRGKRRRIRIRRKRGRRSWYQRWRRV